ncbi:MAG TPA: MraY family glycosyltransferase [Gemmatimonadaceae bacterium]|nr:MraY family glycosyltransferase [Gemmatimonadaceae bacterium]
MPFPAVLSIVFIVAVATSLAVASRLTHVVVRPRLPERSRQWSASRIPRIGGVAIFVALTVAITAATSADAILPGVVPQLPELAEALVVASAILFAVGLLDDIRGVPPVAKLTAQTIAALIVYYSGFTIDHISLLPGYSMSLGILALPITVLWLVGVSNAFNLVDGIDGLAGGVAIIGLMAGATAALMLGNPTVPIYTVALIGALLGFLRYNFPKARLFLGDSGSLVVGFLLAVLVVKGSTDENSVTRALVPIFALAYPLLDTGVAIMRRWLRGVPLSRADHRHIHHQLRALEITPTRSIAIIYGAATAAAAAGLLIAFAPPEVTVAATMVGVAALILAMAFGIHWLEYHEFLAARSSIFSAARNARSVIRDKINARDIAQVIRDAESFQEVQATLHDSAGVFRFAHMKLTDAASRRRAPGRISQELQALKLWKLEYPIIHEDSTDHDGLSLTIWCALEAARRPAGAERIAQIIGPAIADWARANGVSGRRGPGGDDLVLRQDGELVRPKVEDSALIRDLEWEPSKGNSLGA